MLMAEDKESMTDAATDTGMKLANGSVILVGLVAAITYFSHREAALIDLRPAETEASIHEQVFSQQQKIDARLWQDPSQRSPWRATGAWGSSRSTFRS
jgi:hypothetical protein